MGDVCTCCHGAGSIATFRGRPAWRDCISCGGTGTTGVRGPVEIRIHGRPVKKRTKAA